MNRIKEKKQLSDSNVLSSVASHAKVSAGTVSRVFNNSGLISLDTRTRVLESARELGFRPKVKVRNKQIALITEPPWKTLMGGYVNTVTQYICYALSKVNADITLITEDRIDNLANSWFDGVIGIAWEDRTVSMLKELKNLPVVWLSDKWDNFFHTVYIDALETGKVAGNYLIEKGHRKIAVIHESDYTGHKRAEGVESALKDSGIDPASHLMSIKNNIPIHLSVKKLIDAGCTAVWVTGEDMKVIEVNWIIQELIGKKIPQDISIMGFENPSISEFQRPSLTTVESPLRKIAEKAVDIVLSGKVKELQKVKMDVKLIERNSVRKI